MEEITNSKKRKQEIRNEKLRKARQAKFEKRQRVEKISQFRRITDLQNNLRKKMYELATIAHRPGGGGSESMDRRGCAILALEVVPKNLIFA